MIAMLSPAMNMDPAPHAGVSMTIPQFQDRALELAGMMRAYPSWALESLLKVNPDIALRAFGDYERFAAPETDAAPALLAFRGLAYKNIAPGDFSPQDLDWAQRHLRILSALYGLLRPLDGIYPYRLDFMGRVKAGGKNLYHYWGDLVCRALFRETDAVVNLCSGEYERLVLPHLRPGERLVTCRFLSYRGGKLTCRATDAKIARGKMARFIVLGRLTHPDQLKDFAGDDYAFAPEHSSRDTLSFVRR